MIVMSKVLKIWLWFALIVCTLTTVLNALSGRYLSAFIAIGSIVSLGVLLFARRRMALFTLCGFYALSFVVGIFQGTAEGTSLLLAIGASLLGSAVVPVVTLLLMRGQAETFR